MRIIKNIVIAAVTLTMILSTIALAANQKEVVITYNNQKNGFFVSVSKGRDFPSRPNLSRKEYINEVEHLINTAKKYNYNTIYFDAISFGQATFKSKTLPTNLSILSRNFVAKTYDPFEILTQKAKEEGLLVVATVDPFSLDEVKESPFIKENIYVKQKGFTYIDYNNKKSLDFLTKAIKELVSNYKINGVLLTNLSKNNLSDTSNYLEITEDIISDVYKTIKQIDQSMSLGIKLDGDNIIEKSHYDFLKDTEQNIDYYVIDMKRSVENGYENYMKKWSALTEEYNKGLFINSNISRYLSPVDDNDFIDNITYIHDQIYFNNQYKIKGTVFDSYKSLLMNVNSITDNLSIIANNKYIYKDTIEKNKHKLTIAATDTKIDTTKDNFYITGTSDPSLDLYVNDELIEDKNCDGYFIYKAKLSEGENIFKFYQNEQQSQTIIINRINKTSKENINYNPFPKYDEPVYEGKQVTLKITAPKGMKVSANFNNTVYELTQTQYQENIATYTTKLTLPNLSSDEYYENLGNIIYSISDGETIYNKKSSGKMIVFNRKSEMKASVKNFECNVYSDTSERSYIISTLKEGATDYIDKITDEYVHFKSIGYIKRSDISINTDGLNAINNIINIALSSTKNSDILTVVGTSKSPYKISLTDKSITVKLFNISDMPESLAHLRSDIFENINVIVQSKNTATLTFSLKDDKKILGYDIGYENENMIIEFVHEPNIYISNLKPLSGIDILIDAASGGTNNAGFSPDGTSVNSINLYMSNILSHRLKALGANVYMLRTKDELLTLYDRIVRASEAKPDLIISIDNDCFPENFNTEQLFKVKFLNKSKTSQDFAVNLEKSVRDNFTDLKTEITDVNTDIITSSFCPSLSLSFGNVFMPNIYPNLANSFNTYKMAYAISNSIVDSFREI